MQFHLYPGSEVTIQKKNNSLSNISIQWMKNVIHLAVMYYVPLYLCISGFCDYDDKLGVSY